MIFIEALVVWRYLWQKVCSYRIAAQQKKNRAQSPDSASNWDSSEPEETINNVSSGEEVSIRSTKSQKERRSKSQASKQKQQTAAASTPKKQHGQKQTPTKTSTIKTGSAMQKGINSFVDRNAEESGTDSRPVSSRASRKLQDDNPPYDFSAALDIKDSNQGSPADVRPGRSRKGSQYDMPAAGKPAQQKRRGSWDDSEEDEDEMIIMEELRGVMEDEMKVSERKGNLGAWGINETGG
ncbi:hypothetical protein HOLleu_36739 [Holothuria leucospilota]|uniref:Uncharacterized protein n=1 Tax=Holothuria leucospilota TaxID=206669 RepID=A0A9Q0YML2_HOLLE|nr:hypothetical protein HOLleu_36739 [Holothuria leucospilota]